MTPLDSEKVYLVTAGCWEYQCCGHALAVCLTAERAEEIASEARVSGDPPGRWYEVEVEEREIDRLYE